MSTWQLQDAKNRFSALFDQALESGPQRVTRHGKAAVMVVSEEEWQRLSANVPSFGRLLASCPASDEDLPVRRPARALADPHESGEGGG